MQEGGECYLICGWDDSLHPTIQVLQKGIIGTKILVWQKLRKPVLRQLPGTDDNFPVLLCPLSPELRGLFYFYFFEQNDSACNSGNCTRKEADHFIVF